MARALRAAGIEYELIERHTELGGIWDPENPGSPMYESAHFISSKYTSYFYGYPMPEHYPDYPGYRQLRDYIRAFAAEYGLYDRATLGTGVASAELVDGRWQVELTDGQRREYTHLVCANGVTWEPNLPNYRGQDTFTGELRHSSTFRFPAEFADRRVLVVGAGNSGVDIACDAALNASAAFLSVRRGYRFIPKHIFGVPLDVFINEGGELPAGITVPEDPSALIDALVGDLTRYGLPAPDHAALASHPIVNDQIIHHLNHGNITAKGDVKEFRGDTVLFADGSSEKIDLVLFATGYEYSIPYVREDLFEWSHGHPQLYLNIFNRRVDNLYALGFIEFADAALTAIIEDFTPRVIADPRVNWERNGVSHGGFFTRQSSSANWRPTPENVARLKKHLIQFLSLATGGPAKYDGKDMKGAHANMRISNPEFDAVIGDLKASLDKQQIPNKEQKELLAIVESTRPQIVTQR